MDLSLSLLLIDSLGGSNSVGRAFDFGLKPRDSQSDKAGQRADGTIECSPLQRVHQFEQRIRVMAVHLGTLFSPKSGEAIVASMK